MLISCHSGRRAQRGKLKLKRQIETPDRAEYTPILQWYLRLVSSSTPVLRDRQNQVNQTWNWDSTVGDRDKSLYRCREKEASRNRLKRWYTGLLVPHRSLNRSGSMGPWRVVNYKENVCYSFKINLVRALLSSSEVVNYCTERFFWNQRKTNKWRKNKDEKGMSRCDRLLNSWGYHDDSRSKPEAKTGKTDGE